MLQAPVFSVGELYELAHQLDEEERLKMAENGTETEEYKSFMRQSSYNIDERGYFSIQVIHKALSVWDLELVALNCDDSRAKRAAQTPDVMNAYICNYHEHWLTIRKINDCWYNLNSVLEEAKPITNTYLSLYLAQLLTEGYSIFLVWGNLPVIDKGAVTISEAASDHVSLYTYSQSRNSMSLGFFFLH